MKISIFLVLLSVVSVFASKTYSQTTALNLDIKNSTVKEVLKSIEDQSEFVFMYSEKLIDVERKVTVTVEDHKIEEILDALFAGTDVNYRVKDRFILLTTPEVIVNEIISGQQRTVSGTVTESTGEPLPGVTVMIKGTTQGTVTNDGGEYSLTNIPDDATLVFSFVGMRSQEVEVGGQTRIDVEMVVDAIGIEEVVAVGYGTMRKSDLTGSVIRADIEAFRESPNISVMQSLHGNVPGLSVSQVNQAGQEPDILIRGQSSLSGELAPLIVVDGVIFRGNIIDINPNDIESIDILKDASSAAIYGSQASNGVILITTTKSGGIEGKPKFNYSGSFAFQSPVKKLKA
ncbi:MAG TPA: carboxypeptidase-like regulatory domain-containing protein, partial [Mariniphaga sp.]|nr:carboxypeptidase-like regulatory domain-containing protein [Mariniphaga sp.]